MRKVTPENVAEVFTYHKPTDEQITKLKDVRRAGEQLVHAIFWNTPECPDQTAAIRKVREAVMTANAAIVLEALD